MLGLTPPAQAWLRDHHGVITAQELGAMGVARRAVARLVEIGVLRRETRGVFVLEGSAASLEQRCRILTGTYPQGFVTGPTAGVLAGLRRMPPSASLQFSVLHGINPEPERGVRFRQTTSLRPTDRQRRADGIVIASWARLAFDLAADLRQLDHRSVVQQLLDGNKVAVDELAAIANRLCHPARRGSTTFRRTLVALDGGAAQDSHGEVELHQALRTRGVPVEAQVPVLTDQGTIHIDLGVPDARWGIELDVHPEHRTLEGHRNDAARRRGTNDRDWQVELVTELDMADVRKVADNLAVGYRRRLRRLAGDRSTG